MAMASSKATTEAILHQLGNIREKQEGEQEEEQEEEDVVSRHQARPPLSEALLNLPRLLPLIVSYQWKAPSIDSQSNFIVTGTVKQNARSAKKIRNYCFSKQWGNY